MYVLMYVLMQIVCEWQSLKTIFKAAVASMLLI
jgi:hypothetical protein